MNRTIEATLMISAGAVLAAGASFRPMLGALVFNNVAKTGAPASEIADAPVWEHDASEFDRLVNVRVVPCQDAVSRTRSSSSATISTNDDLGGYTVSIADGELKEISVHGEYTLEEEGDTVRILDPAGDVAFETSKSNPSIGDDRFVFQSFGDAFAPMIPEARATLGASLAPVSDAMAAQLGIDGGVIAEFVTPGSGADAAGLAQYDVLIAIDGEPLDAQSLDDRLGNHEPGDTVSVELIRAGTHQTIEITLDASPVIAPVFDAFPFDDNSALELESLRRMLESRIHQSIQAPRRIVVPRWTPLRRSQPRPDAAPFPQKKKPGAIDASEMAPKARAHSVPA